jgi:hypothetical protein
MEFAMATVTVAGEDVTGVQLAGIKPVTVSGRIVLDPAAEQSFQPASTTLISIPADPNVLALGAGMPSKINDDRTFELKAQPGRTLMRLSTSSGGFAIRAVRVEGQDLIDSGLELVANQDVIGVEIELTNQPTTVTGGVTDTRGQPLKDYSVVVFPPDREKWSPTSRHIVLGRPGQDGKFSARVPAGTYFAVALDYIEPGEHLDPEFLDRLRATAVSFSITQSETKAVDLKLTPHP